jgi:Na+/H+ antiporter NhaD/arsenite permease-like protein
MIIFCNKLLSFGNGRIKNTEPFLLIFLPLCENVDNQAKKTGTLWQKLSLCVMGISQRKTPLILTRNTIFLPFLVLLALFALVYPEKISAYPYFVDWHTVLNLTGLLVVVTAIKESAFIGRFSRRILAKTGTERGLAFAIVALSGILSMFLTNDIALFITVPLTLGFQNAIKNDVKKLIIFQALAVNVGSALTPVGNPQNLFLWHQWNISFFHFIGQMAPLFSIMSIVLIALMWISFPSEKLVFQNKQHKNSVDSAMFFLSVAVLITFIAAIELGIAYYALAVVIFIYLIFYRKILIKTDWLLLLLFVVMFIDFHLLSEVPFVTKLMKQFAMARPSDAFVGSLLSSQFMSNVPAAIFISKFSNSWRAIDYGVSVGGNGLVMASLANIIALRFVKERSIWIDFHKYSILYLLLTGGVAYLLFFL